MSTDKPASYGTIVIAVIWIALAVAAVLFFRNPTTTIPDELMGVLRPGPKQIQQFNLTDQNNKPFKLENLNEKWTFMFFGYTFCPDICPTTMSALTSTLSKLKNDPAAVKDVQVVFVSVDPKRDTIEKLKKYVGFFNKEFIGITGKRAEIDALVSQTGAGYAFEEETAPGEYLVSHTSAIFLINPDGELIASFSQPHYPATIAEQFTQIRALY